MMVRIVGGRPHARAPYCRTATTLRHEVFPAASAARMVTAFAPTSSGIDADQLVVPLAVPEDPVFVAQVTAVTPTLPLAVPLKTSVAASVEIVVEEGETIVSVGAAAPAGGLSRVTVIDRQTRLAPAVAVTVISFTPIASGTLEIVQA
jgi:hypothetical protein